jgi:hypothetical protein
MYLYIFLWLQKVIDVLKIDVEGAEWPFFQSILRHPESMQNIKQLCVEIHSPKRAGKALTKDDHDQIFQLLVALEDLGFRVSWVDVNPCCLHLFASFIPKDVTGFDFEFYCY